MNEELKELLGEEIKIEIGNLYDLDPGSDEHSKAVDSLAKLYRLKIEEEKNAMDIEEQRNLREQDEQFKQKQLAEETKDRYFKYGIEAGLGLLTLAFYHGWMKRGFKFEETGTITSKTFMGLTKFFRPTRK